MKSSSERQGDLKEVNEKALRAGAVASLQNPVSIESLVKVIEEVGGTTRWA